LKLLLNTANIFGYKGEAGRNRKSNLSPFRKTSSPGVCLGLTLIIVLLIVLIFLSLSSAALASGYNSPTTPNPTPPPDYIYGEGEDPHGGYSNTTNKCKTCHAVHLAEGNYVLLRATTASDECNYCHATGGVSEKIISGGTHETHLTSDKGPAVDSCNDCHKVHTTIAGAQFTDQEPLATTTVCNNCHSPSGVFDGVNNATYGAKSNWTDGVYEDDGTVTPGKEQWCVGCHDDVPANSKQDGTGILAPNKAGDNTSYGYYATGHGVAGSYNATMHGQNGPAYACTVCHNSALDHISDVPDDSDRLELVSDTLNYTSDISEVCLDCHKVDQSSNGTLGYDATAEATVHSGGVLDNYNTVAKASVAFPAYGDSANYPANSGYQCEGCHDVHGTTKLAMTLETIDGNAGGVSNPKAVSGFESTDSDLTDLDPSATADNGVCDLCHKTSGNTNPHPDTNHSGNHHQGSTGNACMTCHSHSGSFAHGRGATGTGCVQCHGHDDGTLYDPDASAPYTPGGSASQGAGSFKSHSTHTETDADDAKGPGIYCDDCHNINNFPYFKSGTDANGDGKYNLAETDVCNTCHSAGGTYDGVNNVVVGAKNNWDNGVYDGNSLISGKEKWCATCHDESASIIQSTSAPNVIGDEDGAYTYGVGWGFYKTGHGLPSSQFYPATGGVFDGAGVSCNGCHDFSGDHIDGNARTFDGSSPTAYRLGYRLKLVDSQDPMRVPWPWNVANGTDSYRLCTQSGCHDSGPFINSSNLNTNFIVDGSNWHQYHLNQGMLKWSSTWSGSLDSRMTCVSCHNVHGSTQLAMVSDGKLIDAEPGLQIWHYEPGVTYSPAWVPPPNPDNVTLISSTGFIWIPDSANNLCSSCHGGVNMTPKSRGTTPWWNRPEPALTWTYETYYESDGAYPNVILTGGTDSQFRIKYIDKNNIAPISIQVWVDQDNNGIYAPVEQHDMIEVDPGDVNYTDGKLYYANVTITSALRLNRRDNYRFYANNGIYDAIGDPTINTGLDANGKLDVPSEYPSIQTAIRGSYDGDIVSVSNGTYSENLDFQGKEITVESANGAASATIQGDGSNNPVVKFSSAELSTSLLDGFTIDNQGWGGTATKGISIGSNSDPTIQNCIIEGNDIAGGGQNGAGIYINGGTATIESTTIGTSSKPNTTGGNGGAISATALSGPLSISNCTITYNTAATSGGALYLTSTGQTTTITDTTISNNQVTGNHGGAIYSTGPVTISGGTITNNSAGLEGGAIYMTGASASLTIDGTSLTGNSGRYGGAIYTVAGTAAMSVSNATIDSNSGTSGGGVYLNALTGTSTFTNTSINYNTTSSHGGGIYSTGSAMSLTNCTVDGNTVSTTTLDGGGMYLISGASATITGGSVSGNTARYGAGVYMGASCTMTITGATINSNTCRDAGSGGGIYAAGTSLNISKSNIKGNRGGYDGGGIYNAGATTTITNCMITGNSTDQQGTNSDGGGIFSAGTTNIYSSTIAGNYATQNGGGLRVNSGTTTATNSIIWGNTCGGAGAQISGSATVIYSDVEGSYSGTGNINSNPIFIDFQQATSGNSIAAGNFHIEYGSPVIDQATATNSPSDDIDGDNRPQDGGYDMGADEHLTPPGTPILSWTGETNYTTDGVNPDNAAGGSNFEFRIKYTDAENNAPTSIQVWVDQNDNGSYEVTEKYAMNEVDFGDVNYTDGKLYTKTLTLVEAGDNNLNYRFYASDGTNDAVGTPAVNKTVSVSGALDVPGDYASIQAAINAASNGDTVLVADETYSENINFSGKNITVQSVNGAVSTTIRGSGSNAPVVTISSGENANAVLDGFTINNTGNSTLTRGIYISGSTPTIKNSIIEGNDAPNATNGGGGVYIDNSSPTFDTCIIRANSTLNRTGGGIYITGAAGGATFMNSTIGSSGNANSATNGGGIYFTGSATGTLSISGSTVSNNVCAADGPGIYLMGITNVTTITGSTISYNNTGNGHGGGVYSNGSPVWITNSHIDNNIVPSYKYGGGIYLTGGTASLTVEANSTINNNGTASTGGGIYVNGSTAAAPLSINNSTISGNAAGSQGGGIYLTGITNTATITGTTISSNTAASGGAGIFNNIVPLQITGSHIDSNTVTGGGQKGGGLYLTGAAATTITDTTVNSNTTTGLGGGLYVGGGATLQFTGGSINSNTSSGSSGGGVAVDGASILTLSKANIRGNKGYQYGGGIYFASSSATASSITNSTIAGNTLNGTLDGGGIYINNTAMNIINSTIAGNYASRYGGGMRVQAGTVNVKNSILWGNTAGTSGPQISGSPTVSYSDIEGSFAGTGNISSDPSFVSFTAGDKAANNDPKTGGDFHIQSSSPCRDTGNNADAPAGTDIDGDTRIINGTVDMGSDEYVVP